MIDALAPFQIRKYTGVGFGRLHLARPGGLLQLMNELFLPGSFDSPLPTRALAPLLPSPPFPHQCSGSLELAGGGRALSSERTHRHAHARTRPPRDRGSCCAVCFFVALPSPPPLFKSCSKSFLPSFMCAVLLIEELGKHFRGGSRGAQDRRTQDARGEDAWAAGLCSAPCRRPEGGKASAALGPTGESAG